MSNDPDQIRREIETTRVELSTDVDALTYKVDPRRVATERMNRARGRLGRIKDKVMGSATSAGHEGGQRAAEARHRLSDTAHQASDAASSAVHRARSVPQMTQERTEGNPLAVGLIAFGVGLLASSLIPPGQREQQLATQAKRKVMQHSGQIRQQAGEMAHQMQDNLRQPAQQAAQSVRSTATEGVSALRDQGRNAAQHVQGQARESRDDLRRP